MKWVVFLCAVLATLPSRWSIAGIISTTGMVQVWKTPPETVEVNQLERNLVTIVFEEQTKLLEADVEADIILPGFYETVYPMARGFVGAGTTVTSYYFHADPRGQVSPGVRRYKGSVTFDAPIVGILVKPPTLHPTDHLLGLPTVRYPREHDVRHGILEREDYIRLSTDLRTVHFNVGAGLWSDDFRVLVDPSPPPDECHHIEIGHESIEVSSCPAPAASLLWLVGAGAVFGIRHMRTGERSGRPSSMGDCPWGTPPGTDRTR